MAVPLPPSAPERLPVQPWHNTPSSSLDHPLNSAVTSAGVTPATATLIYYDWYAYTHCTTNTICPNMHIHSIITNSHEMLTSMCVSLCGEGQCEGNFARVSDLNLTTRGQRWKCPNGICLKTNRKLTSEQQNLLLWLSYCHHHGPFNGFICRDTAW